MAQVINTNMMSLMAQNNLNKSQNALNNSIQRLSTGYRINTAKDDAAGQGIANRFTSQIRGLTQAARNANDGLSFIQIIEGGVSQINDNLQRMRELTVQALNGVNSIYDVQSIYKELKECVKEIDRIGLQVNFNDIPVLGGFDYFPQRTFSFQVGAYDLQNVVFTCKEIGARKDMAGNASIGKLGVIDDNTEKVTDGWLFKFAEKMGRKLELELSSYESVGDEIPPGYEDHFDILKNLDKFIYEIDNYRGELGATQNRFEAIVTELNGRVNNLTASRSRIEDADYATEVSNMTRAQILQQAGTSILAQANQVPQTVLSLLQ